MALCWSGLSRSLLVANVWPRVMLLVCFVCFLSLVSAAQDFSGYQSDGMFLEAGFLSLFFAPGDSPGLGAATRRAPPCFFLLWEWFRIYFESGVVKLESGDPTGAISPRWTSTTRTARCRLDRLVRAAPAALVSLGTRCLTFALELVLVWMAFLPRKLEHLLFSSSSRRGRSESS